MMKLSVPLVILIALWCCACYRTSGSSDGFSDAGELSDNVAGTGLPEDRYGEETFTAYLVAAEDCYAQALPSLPAYQSMEGGGCWLDIHPSENAPVLPVPEVCGDPPLTSLCFLERIGMIDDASTQQQRQPQGHRETKGMKQRQYAHHPVIRRQAKNLFHPLDIGNDIVVRQHDAFWGSRTTAGKDNRCQIVGRLSAWRAIPL